MPIFRHVLENGLVIVLIVWTAALVNAQPTLRRSTLSIAGSSRLLNTGERSYVVHESIGQSSVIGVRSAQGLRLRQGFIQPIERNPEGRSTSTLNASVYPNPFTGELNITLVDDSPDVVRIELTDMMGRTVFTTWLPVAESISIWPGPLPAGQYVLKIFAHQKRHISKLIKE